jgi:hypothetical protein
LTLAAGVACDNTARGFREDADRAGSAADRARDRASDMAADAQRAAASATESAAEYAERAAEWTAAKVEGAEVKAVLMADPSVDAARVDVDADHRTRMIRLEGSVKTEVERDMAGIIAAGHAPGYRVDNQLTVRP